MKEINQNMDATKSEVPGLFGQKYSSRDYSKPYYW